MKVKFELTRYIPQWKATLEGRPASTKETVEIEVWEHNTRGLETLGEAFAALVRNHTGKIESGKTLFLRSPKYTDNKLLGTQEYYPTILNVQLPCLNEDDDAQKVADQFFSAVRQAYREGSELAAKVAKTLLELPESAWDDPVNVTESYADPIRIRWFNRKSGFAAAEKKLGLPDGYLASERVISAFREHRKLEAHIEAIWERRNAEYKEAIVLVRQQHAERLAEIAKVHEANRARFLELFLSTCTDVDRERYDRGFISAKEMRNRVREVLFGDFKGTRYRRMTASEFCDECEDVNFSVVEDPSLNSEQFAMLKEVEAFFTAPEFSVKIRKHWGRCSCDAQGQATALVTWQLPGVDPLSREYEIGFAITP